MIEDRCSICDEKAIVKWYGKKLCPFCFELKIREKASD